MEQFTACQHECLTLFYKGHTLQADRKWSSGYYIKFTRRTADSDGDGDMVTNDGFLRAIFGDDAPFAHVTGFPYDPGNIPKDKHLIAWKGDYHSRYRLQPNHNQYFTISAFYCDDQSQARRRKALFRYTPCIVLDDVKEKLSMTEVAKLPQPSWILESSAGSEQWGYILNTLCEDRGRVENLLDGLVANGLAPDGKDPGMKGVTRYLRLPEGINNKVSKLVNGQPFKCRMLVWEPTRRVTMEQLAAPFAVDLDAVRRESRVDGAAAVSDHPLINIPDIIHIKEVRSDGRFDIKCPWVDEHTGADDSGAAVFTNEDGTIGYKCHHGNCQSKTGKDLLRFIDAQQPGWSVSTLKNWQIMRSFDVAAPAPAVSFLFATGDPNPLNAAAEDRRFATVEEVSFMTPVVPTPPAPVAPAVSAPTADAIQLLCDMLRRQIPSTPEARTAAGNMLKHVDDMPKMDQKHWHEQVCDIMRWSKADFRDIIKDLRAGWYVDNSNAADFYDNVVYVKELNQFYDLKSRIFFSTEAFQNSFAHEDAEARKVALQDGRVRKVDKLDYAPKQPQVFVEGHTMYGNMWSDADQPQGTHGDVTRWHDHFDALGWGEHRKHVEQWMAYTLRHPDRKINHMLLLGSGEGCGKDFLLYPLIEGMGENAEVISGEELVSDFNEYLLSTKYLHINETELGDRREAMAVSNKLKPIASAPPNRLGVNQKGIRRIKVRNIVNGTMTTNSQLPLRLNGPSRRFFALWSDMNPRGEDGQMRADWLAYWEDRWNWMRGGGWLNVLHYLHHEVDLTGFNPGEAPPVTEFLKDIQESSKTPQQQTIEAFISNRIGMFKCDLLSAQDMSDTVRTEGVFSTNNVYCDVKYLTPVGIGRALSGAVGVVQLRGRRDDSQVRLYAIRDAVKYQALGASDLYREYERQVAAVRGATPLTVVK